jgi:hypothetical protein
VILMDESKKLLAEGWLRVRTVIELVGKPKEHIEQTMKNYIGRIKGEKDIKIVDHTVADIEKKDIGSEEEGMVKDMWATFAELDMFVKDPTTLTYFCLDYMPSSIEISDPTQVTYTSNDLTEFFNDLQARLHSIDLIAKQTKSETVFLRKNIEHLLRNFITILVSQKGLTITQIANITGVKEEGIGDLLDKWVEDKLMVLDGELYSLARKDAEEKEVEEKNEE